MRAFAVLILPALLLGCMSDGDIEEPNGDPGESVQTLPDPPPDPVHTRLASPALFPVNPQPGESYVIDFVMRGDDVHPVHILHSYEYRLDGGSWQSGGEPVLIGTVPAGAEKWFTIHMPPLPSSTHSMWLHTVKAIGEADPTDNHWTTEIIAAELDT